MFTVLVLKRTRSHSFYMYFLYVLVWAAESPQIHTACDYNYMDYGLTLIESECVLMLGEKTIDPYFIRYTLSILDWTPFCFQNCSFFVVCSQQGAGNCFCRFIDWNFLQNQSDLSFVIWCSILLGVAIRRSVHCGHGFDWFGQQQFLFF